MNKTESHQSGDLPKSSGVDKETRLVRIVQRLEAKVKTIWDENKQLTQQLELAQLDREIAQEQCESLKHELEVVRSRIIELEELRELSGELESTYLADKQRLEGECQMLQRQLNEVSFNAQRFENLQLDLANAQRQLKVADLELGIVKNGAADTLGPMFTAHEQLDWLPLIDILHLDIEDIFLQYKKGDVSLSKLASKLSEYVDKCLDLPKTFERAEQLPLDSAYIETPRWRRAAEALRRKQQEREQQSLSLSPSVGLNESTSTGNTVKDENYTKILNQKEDQNSALLLRISVLESKLEKAHTVSKELEELHEWQQEAQSREQQLEESLREYKKSVSQKEHKILELQRANLPFELVTAKHNMHVDSLHGVIAMLSSHQPSVTLERFENHQEHKPFSRLLGNSRVQRLRELAPTFHLGKSIDEARALAVEQSAQLMFL